MIYDQPQNYLLPVISESIFSQEPTEMSMGLDRISFEDEARSMADRQAQSPSLRHKLEDIECFPALTPVRRACSERLILFSRDGQKTTSSDDYQDLLSSVINESLEEEGQLLDGSLEHHEVRAAPAYDNCINLSDVVQSLTVTEVSTSSQEEPELIQKS